MTRVQFLACLQVQPSLGLLLLYMQMAFWTIAKWQSGSFTADSFLAWQDQRRRRRTGPKEATGMQRGQQAIFTCCLQLQEGFASKWKR